MEHSPSVMDSSGPLPTLGSPVGTKRFYFCFCLKHTQQEWGPCTKNQIIIIDKLSREVYCDERLIRNPTWRSTVFFLSTPSFSLTSCFLAWLLSSSIGKEKGKRKSIASMATNQTTTHSLKQWLGRDHAERKLVSTTLFYFIFHCLDHVHHVESFTRNFNLAFILVSCNAFCLRLKKKHPCECSFTWLYLTPFSSNPFHHCTRISYKSG